MLELETERLLLRKPRLDDAEAFAPLLADVEVMRFIGGVGADPPRAVVERWLQRWQDNGVGPFVVSRRNDGRVLGRVGLNVWDTGCWRTTTVAEAGDRAQPEVGWVLAREHWGNGYATEAAEAARRWARTAAGVDRLISLIAPDNVASQRVAEKLACSRSERVTLEVGVPCDVWVHPR